MEIKVTITASHEFTSITEAAKELNVQTKTLYHRILRDELDICYPFPNIQSFGKSKSQGPGKGTPATFIIKNDKYKAFLDVVNFNKEVKTLSDRTEKELNQESITQPHTTT